MKTDNPIVINRARAKEPPGGPWTLIDPVTRGKVQILDLPKTPGYKPRPSLRNSREYPPLTPTGAGITAPSITRQWNHLDAVRSLCQLQGIPVQMANEELPPVWHLRETQSLHRWTGERPSNLITAHDVQSWLADQNQIPG